MNEQSNNATKGATIDLAAVTPELTLLQELKGTFFQFHTLYSSWVIERAQAASQAYDVDKLIKHCDTHLKAMEKLSFEVSQFIGQHIQEATDNAVESIGELVGKNAAQATDQVTKQLAAVVTQTEHTLQQYQQKTRWHQWVVIGVSVIATVATCLFLVKWLMPQPMLPLTSTQLSHLWTGEIMADIWPKLSEADKKHLRDVAYKAGHFLSP